jgi:hypothetical protein
MFSAPYALIAAISDGDISLASFDDHAVARPEVQARLADVLIEEVAGPPLTFEEIGASPVRLELLMVDGSKRRFERTAAPGSSADALASKDLRTKWIDCLRRANRSMTPERAAALHARGVTDLGSNTLGPWLQTIWEESRPSCRAQRRRASA